MMDAYERELMANGTYLIRRCEPIETAPDVKDIKPKRTISPYAKFDKYHHKKKRK